jgi:serine/threonine protein kinase
MHRHDFSQLIYFLIQKRDILGRINNPFVVKLYYAFRTRRFLFLVMEYLPGGDLHSFLKKNSIDEDSCRIYAAEIVLALEYLHASEPFYYLIFLLFFLYLFIFSFLSFFIFIAFLPYKFQKATSFIVTSNRKIYF